MIVPNKKRENILEGILFYKKLGSLFTDLNSRLNYAVIKGEALSVQAYGGCGYRRYGDIDILVNRDDFTSLEKILNDNGFEQFIGNKNLSRYDRIYAAQSHQTKPFRKDCGSYFVEIDVNLDLFWGEYHKKRIDIKQLLKDTILISIYNCEVKTLTVQNAFIQLCLHHFKEFNSFDHIVKHNPLKEQLFSDAYYMIKNNPKLTVKVVADLADEYDITPYIYYVLFYTNEVFGDGMLEDYLSAIKTAEGEELLNKYGLSDYERKEWKVDFNMRYHAQDLFALIKDDLSERDLEKIKSHNRIFG